MKTQPLTKDQWIQAAYDHLVKRLCAKDEVVTPVVKHNLSTWAEALYDDGYGSGYGIEGYDPVEAVEEDFSYA